MDIDDKKLEREIQNAIRARGLKEQMKQWEADRKQQPDYPHIPAAASMLGECASMSEPCASMSAAPASASKPVASQPRQHKLRRTIFTLSAVAVLVGVVVMVVPVSVWKSGYRQASRWAYQQYAHYFLQDSRQVYSIQSHMSPEAMLAMVKPSLEQMIDERVEKQILGHEDMIQDAAWQIIKGNYAVAQSILEDAREELSQDDPDYQDDMDDLDYLLALCYYGQGQLPKAMALLQSIADSDSRHSQAAADLLK
jgi:hypothetical protein